MLQDRIRTLFRDCDEDVREVLAEVVAREWAMLSYERPRGILEAIRDIIDARSRLTEDET